MLKNLGDRELLMLALAPVAVFIVAAFILIVGPRIGLLPKGAPSPTPSATATPVPTPTTVPPTVTAVPSPTASPTPSLTPVPPTATIAPASPGVTPSATAAASILLWREQPAPG